MQRQNTDTQNFPQRMEFSKKILVVMAIATFAIVTFACVLMWITRDTGPFAYLIPSLFAELGVGTGFYFNKAKAENEIKLRMQCKDLGLEDKMAEPDQPQQWGGMGNG